VRLNHRRPVVPQGLAFFLVFDLQAQTFFIAFSLVGGTGLEPVRHITNYFLLLAFFFTSFILRTVCGQFSVTAWLPKVTAIGNHEIRMVIGSKGPVTVGTLFFRIGEGLYVFTLISPPSQVTKRVLYRIK
jgi:hypothetical protein